MAMWQKVCFDESLLAVISGSLLRQGSEWRLFQKSAECHDGEKYYILSKKYV